IPCDPHLSTDGLALFIQPVPEISSLAFIDAVVAVLTLPNDDPVIISGALQRYVLVADIGEHVLGWAFQCIPKSTASACLLRHYRSGGKARPVFPTRSFAVRPSPQNDTITLSWLPLGQSPGHGGSRLFRNGNHRDLSQRPVVLAQTQAAPKFPWPSGVLAQLVPLDQH